MMSLVQFTITVLYMLLVLRVSEARKRSYYFRQQNAKTNDKSIDCCLKLIAENSMEADFNHTTGQCDTSAIIDANSTRFIKFRRLDLLFEESDIIETGELPALLGYREESQYLPIPSVFHVEPTIPQDNDWIRFDFVDGVYTRFSTRLLFVSSKPYLQWLDSDSNWKTRDQFHINGTDDIVRVDIKQYSRDVQVYLSNGEFDTIFNDYEPFESIRYNSSFATCGRISFRGYIF